MKFLLEEQRFSLILSSISKYTPLHDLEKRLDFLRKSCILLGLVCLILGQTNLHHTSCVLQIRSNTSWIKSSI